MAKTTYKRPTRSGRLRDISSREQCCAWARRTALKYLKQDYTYVWTDEMSREFTKYFDNNVNQLWRTPNQFGGCIQETRAFDAKALILTNVAVDQFLADKLRSPL